MGGKGEVGAGGDESDEEVEWQSKQRRRRCSERIESLSLSLSIYRQQSLKAENERGAGFH